MDEQASVGNTYNFLDDRIFKIEYYELLENGKEVAGRSSTTWDDERIKISIDLPIDMTNQRYLEIFQSILLDAVKASNHEKEKKNGVS